MNGVVILSLKGGACLYSQKYRDKYGLPAGSADGDGQSMSSGSDVDGMNMSALLYALNLNAEAAFETDEDKEDGSPGSSAGSTGGSAPSDKCPLDQTASSSAITSWRVGETEVFFHSDATHGVMAALYADIRLGEDIPRLLVHKILARFVSKYSKQLAKHKAVNRRFTSFTPILRSLLLEVPDMILSSVTSKLAPLQPQWLYVAVSDEMFVPVTSAVAPVPPATPMPGRGGRMSNGARPASSDAATSATSTATDSDRDGPSPPGDSDGQGGASLGNQSGDHWNAHGLRDGTLAGGHEAVVPMPPLQPPPQPPAFSRPGDSAAPLSSNARRRSYRLRPTPFREPKAQWWQLGRSGRTMAARSKVGPFQYVFQRKWDHRVSTPPHPTAPSGASKPSTPASTTASTAASSPISGQLLDGGGASTPTSVAPGWLPCNAAALDALVEVVLAAGELLACLTGTSTGAVQSMEAVFVPSTMRGSQGGYGYPRLVDASLPQLAGAASPGEAPPMGISRTNSGVEATSASGRSTPSLAGKRAAEGSAACTLVVLRWDEFLFAMPLVPYTGGAGSSDASVGGWSAAWVKDRVLADLVSLHLFFKFLEKEIPREEVNFNVLPSGT
eukprot:jgi/Mesvir1/23922/Mv10699-RA.1